MNIGTAIPDPHQAIAEQLAAQVDAYLSAGGKVTVGPPFNYTPRPPARFNNQAPVVERKEAGQKRRDELAKRNALVRELAKTMTYNEAAKATGIAMATLHRIAKEGDFLFQVSEGRSGNGRKIDRKADAAKLERLVSLRDCGMSRNAVANRMGISDKLLERLIEDYSIDFPARGLRRLARSPTASGMAGGSSSFICRPAAWEASMANKDKAKGAEYSRKSREKKKAEDARLGVEQVVIEMPAGIKKLLAAEVKAHGYDQVQALWQDLALSWAAADRDERARRLQRPGAPAFEISPKLARQYERVAMAELRKDPGDEIVSPGRGQQL